MLADLINISLNFFENKLYLSPEQRHTHVKVAVLYIFLIPFQIFFCLLLYCILNFPFDLCSLFSLKGDRLLSVPDGPRVVPSIGPEKAHFHSEVGQNI